MLLDGLKVILPSKHKIVFADLPATGDCVVISETEITRGNVDLDIGSGDTVCLLQFFTRHAPRKDIYSEIRNDLLEYHSLIERKLYSDIGGKIILSVSDASIIPSGRDKDGNLIFSMTIQVTYR